MYLKTASLDISPAVWQGFVFSNNFALVYGFNKKEGFKNKGVEGEYLPLIPPAKWLSSINQEIKTASGVFTLLHAKLELEYNGAQNRFLSLYNTETKTPAYTLINISAGAKLNYLKDQPLQIQVQVNNLFDIAYQSNLSRLKYFEYYSVSPTAHYGMYNMGRNISVKLLMGF